MATPKTILLKGDGVFKEAAAGGAVTPGHLININSSGAFVVHGTAGGDAFPMFAVEDDIQGKDITDAYASGDQCFAVVPARGAEIYALVPAAASAIVVGDILESNGDGTLRKGAAAAVTATNLRRIVARALEAVNNSGGGTPARIKVEVV